MKNRTNASALGKSVLMLPLGVACALPVAAQTANGATTGTTGSTGTTSDTTITGRDRDDGFDWGWLGLLGLGGLAGLRRKPAVQDVHRTSTAATH